MPVPPPVTTTVLPLAESSGRMGDMDWYVLLCHVEVGDGKGAIVIVGRMDYWAGWDSRLMRNMSPSEQSLSLYTVVYTAPIQRRSCTICEANCGHHVYKNLCGFCTRLPDARVQCRHRKRFRILGIETYLAFANCSVLSTMLTPAKNCSGTVPLTRCPVKWRHGSMGI